MLTDGADTLTVVEALREEGGTVGAVSAALSVAEALARATDLPPGFIATRGALEQASHPQVSAWRARRYEDGGHVVDLCAGVGLDTISLARSAGSVTAVEVDESRAVIARHNAAAAGTVVRHLVGDAKRPPVRLDRLVHADPSRRSAGRRARRLRDYGPPIPALLAGASTADGVGVVVSPAVDTADPDLPDDAEVEFIQVGDRLVEGVLWLGSLRSASARATRLPEGATLTRSGPPAAPLTVGDPGEWLVEIAPAAVRARLHDELGSTISARRLARRRALLTTDDRPPSSPWWHADRIKAVLPLRAASLRTWLREHNQEPVELRSHGVEADLDRFWRDAGRPARGPGGRVIHLVRLDRGATVIISGGR